MDKIYTALENNIKLDSHIEKDVELENTDNKTDNNKLLLSSD
jgi:hypothetical protein